MARGVSKKIEKLVDAIEWEKFDGYGSLIIDSCGLKYIQFNMSGDWSHMHERFKRYLATLGESMGLKVKQVECHITEDCGDWYRCTRKFSVQ